MTSISIEISVSNIIAPEGYSFEGDTHTTLGVAIVDSLLQIKRRSP
jgi:hypothetical protein